MANLQPRARARSRTWPPSWRWRRSPWVCPAAASWRTSSRRAPGVADIASAIGRGIQTVQEGVVSWYGAQFHDRKTASGERFDSGALTMAHPEPALRHDGARDQPAQRPQRRGARQRSRSVRRQAHRGPVAGRRVRDRHDAQGRGPGPHRSARRGSTQSRVRPGSNAWLQQCCVRCCARPCCRRSVPGDRSPAASRPCARHATDAAGARRRFQRRHSWRRARRVRPVPRTRRRPEAPSFTCTAAPTASARRPRIVQSPATSRAARRPACSSRITGSHPSIRFRRRSTTPSTPIVRCCVTVARRSASRSSAIPPAADWRSRPRCDCATSVNRCPRRWCCSRRGSISATRTVASCPPVRSCCPRRGRRSARACTSPAATAAIRWRRRSTATCADCRRRWCRWGRTNCCCPTRGACGRRSRRRASRSNCRNIPRRWHVFQANAGVLADADRALESVARFLRERGLN